VRLDGNGTKLSEMLAPGMDGMGSVELADHSLVTTSFDVPSSQLDLKRFDTSGHILAGRIIKCYGSLLLRSVEATNTIRVITYAVGIEGTLYTLNENLENAEPPTTVADFYTTNDGFGYVLPDRSLLLFGHTNNAAVVWVRPSGGFRARYTFGLKYDSFVVDAAIPLSGTEFVTARYSGSPNPSDRGLVISWLSLKTFP